MQHARRAEGWGHLLLIPLALLGLALFSIPLIGLLVRTDPRRIGLLQAAGLVLLIGLVVPYWLHAGVILAIAGALVLLFEGTRAL